MGSTVENDVAFLKRFLTLSSRLPIQYDSQYCETKSVPFPKEFLDIAIDGKNEAAMAVHVKHLKKGLTLNLRANSSTFVKAIKQDILKQMQIPLECQRLLLKGKVLADDKVLSSYTTENEINLTLMEKEQEKEQEMQFTSLKDTAFGKEFSVLLSRHFKPDQAEMIMKDFDSKYSSLLE